MVVDNTVLMAVVVATQTIVVAWLNRKSNDTQAALKLNTDKTDEVIENTVKIESLTNGHLSELTVHLKIANDKLVNQDILMVSSSARILSLENLLTSFMKKNGEHKEK